MNLLKISPYFDVYELADVLAQRAAINAVLGNTIVKSHTALSRQGDTFDLIDELQQALSWREVDADTGFSIINQIATVDDKVLVNSLSRNRRLQSAVLVLDEESPFGNRKLFQEAEDCVKKHLAGEEISSEKYLVALIDLFNTDLQLGDIPYDRKLSINGVNLLHREENLITKKIKEYIKSRQRVLEENTIRISDKNKRVIIGDLKDLIESARIFEDFNIEINPTEDSLLLRSTEAQLAVTELTEKIKSGEVDFIKVKCNEWGDTITIEAFYKNY
jgi:hypothetical protein